MATERLERGAQGVQAFNLFSVAEADIPKVQQLHVEFFERLRDLVGQSEPSERLLLYAAQIVPLDG